MEVKTKDWTTGNKEAPKANQGVKQTAVKLSFILSRWSRMVVSHRLSTLLPGLPACFSLKQGVTHKKTSTYNFLTCQSNKHVHPAARVFIQVDV